MKKIEAEKPNNQELNRTLTAYFKFCGEKCGNEGYSTEGFRKYENPTSVWIPIRWGPRSNIIKACWFLTNPPESEYGFIAEWADGIPENIFGYIDKTGKQVIVGKRDYITFYSSVDGSKARFDDNYYFFCRGKTEDAKFTEQIRRNLVSSRYRSDIMNFTIPESPNRQEWSNRGLPREDQLKWLEDNKPNPSPYDEINKAIGELSRLFPRLYPPFADFQRLNQVVEDNKNGK